MTQLFCFNAAWCDRFRTRGRRRAIAMAYISVLGSLLAVTWFYDSYLALLFGSFIAATVLLHLSTRSIADQASSALDEHQVAIRNAAYQRVYRPATMVAFLGGFLITSFSDQKETFDAGLFVAVWGLMTGLPTLLVAWTLPAEADNEE